MYSATLRSVSREACMSLKEGAYVDRQGKGKKIPRDDVALNWVIVALTGQLTSVV